MLEVVSSLSKYHFDYFVQFFDYSKWLSGCFVDLVGISGCHYFHFTKDGVNAYVDDLETPLSPNPVKIIRSIPNFAYPPFLTPSPISAERLKKFKNVKKPEGTKGFWDDLLAGGLGTTQPKLLNPNFIEHVCYKKLDIEVKVSNTIAEPESRIKSFRKLLPDHVNDCYVLETEFFGEEDTFFLNERKTFIDETAEGEETKCKEFQDWENQHPTLKKKFLKKPSQVESTTESENDTIDTEKAKKKKLDRKSVGNLLSQGRSG